MSVEYYEWQTPFTPLASKISAPAAHYGHPVVRASRNGRKYTKAQIIKLAGRNAPISEDRYRYPRSRKEG